MSLQALRAASLRTAGEEAERLLDSARERANQTIAEAQRQAADLLEGARAQAHEQARRLVAAGVAQARREARHSVLAAREAALERLHERAHRATASLRDDPDYARLVERLAEDARARLRPGPAEVLAAPDGGVIVRGPGRQIDLTLNSQVERCLHDLGARVEVLWT